MEPKKKRVLEIVCKIKKKKLFFIGTIAKDYTVVGLSRVRSVPMVARIEVMFRPVRITDNSGRRGTRLHPSVGTRSTWNGLAMFLTAQHRR